jgi:hypothetical protein
VKVLHLPARSDSATNYARELLRRCESGEVIAVTALEERCDSTYTVQGTKTTDSTTTAGRLLDAAITRLSQDD